MGGSGRSGAWRGGGRSKAGQDRTRTGRFALDTTDPCAFHGIGFPGMPCMKHTETNKRRSTGHQPGTKSVRGPANKTRINRGSTGYRVPPFGLHRISFVRASGESFNTVVFDCLEGKGVGCFLGEPTRRRPVLPRPALPPRRAPRRLDQPVVCPSFGFDK